MINGARLAHINEENDEENESEGWCTSAQLRKGYQPKCEIGCASAINNYGIKNSKLTR